MTLQRGRDPRQLTLVAFGGAGGLMAAGLARALGIPRVLIPRDPGVLSAAGLAHARFASEAARVWLTDLAQVQKGAFRTGWRDLKAEVLAIARLEGQGPKAIELATHANLRYRGQSFELVLPAGDDPRALAPRFHAAHTHFFGYALQDRAVELVSLTVRGTQRTSDSVMPKPRAKACTLPSSGVIQRENLKPGHHFAGPAIVSEYSGTTSIPAGVTARVTSGAHLLLEIG
jgi:N-methylhydantoinase A